MIMSEDKTDPFKLLISVLTLFILITDWASCQSPQKNKGTQLLFPVALLHAAAFFLSYWISKLSFGESTSRTISIECGMQSSTLGFLLAQKHFTNPLVAVPSAVSVVCMAEAQRVQHEIIFLQLEKPVSLHPWADYEACSATFLHQQHC